MKNTTSLLIFCTFVASVLLVLFPETVLAASWWENPKDDQSIFYLNQIFGNMGDILSGEFVIDRATGKVVKQNNLIGSLFGVFNQAVLILGTIVVSYTIILSTINTAQEGEVMGRKWSSIWIPLRSALGVAFLIPIDGGYSAIQVIMMKMVVYGVAAGNKVWSEVIVSLHNEKGLNASFIVEDVKTPALAIYNSEICMQTLNNDANCKSSLGIDATRQVVPYQENNRLVFGIPNDNSYSNVCGSYQAAGAPYGLEQPAWDTVSITALQETEGTARGVVDYFYQNQNSEATWGSANSNFFSDLMASLHKVTSLQPPDKAIQPSAISDAVLKNAIGTGWLLAGSYYFELISERYNKEFTYPSPIVTNYSNDANQLGDECSQALNETIARGSKYLTATNVQNSPNRLVLNRANVKDEKLNDLFKKVTGPIEKLFEKFMIYLSTNKQSLIPSLAGLGGDIMLACELTWVALIVGSFVILLIACIASGFNSACWAFAMGISVAVPIITVIILLFWAAGALIGLYVPLIPYLVFTFTAVGWILLVVETIAAAPVVALGLVSPSAEHLGRASPAIILIMNVFLRPSLMVIGLIAAARVADVLAKMVNYGFFAVTDSLGQLGILGSIVLLCLYGGLMMTLVNEAFSLIHLLPEKIIRWVGGQVEHSRVAQMMGETKKSAQQGIKLSEDSVKAAGTAYGKAVGQFGEMVKGGGGGGAPPGGGGAPPSGGSGGASGGGTLPGGGAGPG